MLIFVRTERVLVQGDRDAQAAKKTNGGFKKKMSKCRCASNHLKNRR
jgi:hypothetical protein